jgi:hypothetical protein
MLLIDTAVFNPNHPALTVEVNAVLNGLVCAFTLIKVRGEHIVNACATRAATGVIATVVRLRSGYGYSAKSASRHT